MRFQINLTKYLLCYLVLFTGIQFKSFAQIDLCPQLQINNNTNPGNNGVACYKTATEYEINYERFTDITWSVKGGIITKIKGVDISNFITISNTGYTLGGNFYPLVFAPGGIIGISSITIHDNNVTDATLSYSVGSTIEEIVQDNLFEVLGDIIESLLTTSDYNDVTIVWTSSHGHIDVAAKNLGVLLLCGDRSNGLDVTVVSPVKSNFVLQANLQTTNCNQGVSVGGWPNYTAGASYSWNIPGANITSNWGSGIYVNNFTDVGLLTISSSMTYACGTINKTGTIQVNQPDFGTPQQNGANVGNVIPDCNGNFYLAMNNWISNDAIYTWNLPSGTQSGNNLRNVSGNYPVNTLQDYNGSVTVSNVCGPSVTKFFTVKARTQPTVPVTVSSCSNTVVIHSDNLSGSNCNWYSTNGGTFTNQSCNSVVFTAPGPGTYNVVLGTSYGLNSCYLSLQTTVIIGSGTNNNTISGWESGELSETPQTPGSNIVPDYNQNQNQKIYFAGRDGKLYYYAFDQGFAKWVLYNIPGITDVIIPAAGKFTKIGYNFQGSIPYLYYINNQNQLIYVNMNSYTFLAVINGFVPIYDFALNLSGEVYIYRSDNNWLANAFNPNFSLLTVNNATLKDAVYGLGLVYIVNNNLYNVNSSGAVTQLTNTGDVYPTTDVVDYGTNLYFVRGTNNGGNLYNLTYSPILPMNQITYTYNLSGVLTANPNNGTIYYGTYREVVSTHTSGSFAAGDIYEAYYTPSNYSWNIIKATNGSVAGTFDTFIHGASYSNNHLYFVGWGNSAVDINYDLEVWNLFYLNGCTPSVLRQGNFDDNNNTASTDASIDNIAYPNPFSNQITVDLRNYTSENSVFDIELFNANGVSVYTGKSSSTQTSISTENFPSGMYILIVKQNGEVVQSKKLTHTN